MTVQEEAQSDSGVNVREDALPASLAQELRFCLAELPPTSWRLTETKHQPQHRASIVPLRFFQLKTAEKVRRHAANSRQRPSINADEQSVERTREESSRQVHTTSGEDDVTRNRGQQKPVTQRVRDVLEMAMALHPHERMFLNFSKYEEGCFLDSHTDEVSGSLSYRRRQAFVWHLSEDWEEGDGGLFVDEEAEGGPRLYKPCFNSLVTFSVPRRHSVTRVTAARSGRRARFAAYGWVVVPKVETIDWLALPQLLSGDGQRAAAILCLHEPLDDLGEAASALFAGLPLEDAEDVGEARGRDLGHFCLFAVLSGKGAEPAWQLLGASSDAEAAVAVFPRPAALDGNGHPLPVADARRVCADPDILRSGDALRHFVLDALRSLRDAGAL